MQFLITICILNDDTHSSSDWIKTEDMMNYEFLPFVIKCHVCFPIHNSKKLNTIPTEKHGITVLPLLFFVPRYSCISKGKDSRGYFQYFAYLLQATSKAFSSGEEAWYSFCRKLDDATVRLYVCCTLHVWHKDNTLNRSINSLCKISRKIYRGTF